MTCFNKIIYDTLGTNVNVRLSINPGCILVPCGTHDPTMVLLWFCMITMILLWFCYERSDNYDDSYL